MKDDNVLKNLYDQAIQGLKEQSMNSVESNSSTTPSNQSQEMIQPSGGLDSAAVSVPRTAEDWAAIPKGPSAGSSRPLQTGIGARRRNHDNED